MEQPPSQRQTRRQALLSIAFAGVLLGVAVAWFWYRSEASLRRFRPPTPTPTAFVLPFGLLPTPTATPWIYKPPTRYVPMAGEAAQEFTLPNLDGQAVSLSDYGGSVVVLNFWASWCPPCKAEMPALQQAYDRHKDDGLVVLGINTTFMDDLPAAEDFAAGMELTFPILLDEDGQVSDVLYFVRSLPTSVWIDREGIVRHVQFGEMNAEQIEEWAAELLD
jgi:peroxiredoxin